jgi:hypothetical protein
MRLADSEIAISLEKETIHLRASLRAAYRLEQRYGFQDLCEAIARCDLAAAVDLISVGSTDPKAVDYFFDYLRDSKSLLSGLMEVREPLLKFVLLLSGAEDRINDSEPTGTPIPFAEYHERLFRIATGWLSWSPEQAWNATPAEIIEAQKGRIEMLGAIFGSSTGKDDDTTTDISSARDRLNALGNGAVTDMRDVPA